MATFTPQTTFYLIKNVDIDVSYTHEYYFESANAQYTFFYSKVFKTVENGTYQRKNSNQIDVPFNADEIRECKYLMWQNANYSNKWYYAFVTMIDYINPSLSRISYELDVYQTYLFEMTWKQSFVEREHTQRYRTNGLPVINLEDEGLDYGNEYKIIERHTLRQFEGVAFLILGFDEDMHSGVDIYANDVSGIPNNLCYYVLPFNINPNYHENQANFTFAYDGTDFQLPRPAYVFTQCRSNPSLVGHLKSCTVVPFLPCSAVSCSSTVSGGAITYYINSRTEGIDKYQAVSFNADGNLKFMKPFYKALDILEIQDGSDIYTNFPSYAESKLLMYPYSFTELTNNRGNSYVIKNEFVNSGNGGKITIGIIGTISFANHMSYLVKDYLGITGYIPQNGLNDTSTSEMPIIDDYTASYLQSNQNSIRVEKSNALRIQNDAMTIASNNFDTASANATRTLNGQLLKATGEVAMGALQLGTANAFSGNNAIYGQQASGIGNVISGIDTVIQSKVGYSNSIASAETSLANARISSATDYETKIASINAKVHDTELVPGNTRSMGGDFLFNIINDCDKLYLLKKTIQTEYANKLTDYFKQYGYKVNKIETPSFHTRQSWNYIKMAEPNVYGNIPMDDLLKLRDIFIKGITLWHGDYIGNYSRSNNEL